MYYDYKRKNFSDKDILDKKVTDKGYDEALIQRQSCIKWYKMFMVLKYILSGSNFNFVGVIGLKK